MTAMFTNSVVIVLSHVLNFISGYFWRIYHFAWIYFSSVVVVEDYIYKEPVSEKQVENCVYYWFEVVFVGKKTIVEVEND